MRLLTKNPLMYLTAAACASACGSLAPDTNQAPVLATIHGELTNLQLPALSAGPSHTRVAVLWHGAHGYSIAEDLPVQSLFPSQFVLRIRQPPPADAIWTQATASSQTSGGVSSSPPVGNNDAPSADTLSPADSGPIEASVHPLGTTAAPWPADFGIAFGSIVAYEDLNGNGKLDLIDDGATSYVDRILGANSSLALVYVQATLAPGTALPSQLADESGNMPVRGFNLFHLSECPIALTPLGTPGGTPTTPTTPPCTDKNVWLASDSIFLLPLTADPKFATLMCKAGNPSFQATGGSGQETAGSGGSGASQPGSSSTPGSPGQAGDGGPDAPVSSAPTYPAMGDPYVSCASDGLSFTDCPPPPGPPPQPSLCGGALMGGDVGVSCGSVLVPSIPAPANWPCTVNH
ncbi:MAG TPA: hypothetical protein VGY54_25395 [Polyangiaceae bacterium]|nr:hypothetical protein [Polyangiaceae bacterium]